MKLEIPSFGHVGRPGDVYLPIRTVRIAIPEGSGGVRLAGWHGTPRPVEGVDLAPPIDEARVRFGTAAALRRARGSGSRAAAARSSEPEGFAPPGDPVRLGDVGYLRDQRFVEVIYTPVVSPRGGGQARFFGELDVDLVVEGVDPGAVSGEPAPPDPAFEEIYRAALVNYDEGRHLRAAGRGGRWSAAPPSGLLDAAESIEASEPGVENGFPVYKIAVSKTGIYRLSQSYLLGAAPGLAGADPRQFKLMNRGVEVPLHVRGEVDGSFDAADYVEFYGQRLEAAEMTLNYNLGLLPSIYEYEDYGDLNVYWLSVDGSGQRSRMAVRSAPPNLGYPVEPDFAETVHSEVDNLFQPSGGEDPFLMSPRLWNNSGTVAADANTCNYTNPGVPSQANGRYLKYDPADPSRHCPVCRVSLPGFNPAASGTASVKVRLRGTTIDPNAVVPDHLVVLEVNQVPSQSTHVCFSGLSFVEPTVTLPHALLTDPVDMRIEQPGLAAAANPEEVVVDWTEVTYRRLFAAVSDGLRFTIPDQSRRIEVSGLSTGSADAVALYEVTATMPPASALGGPEIVVPVRVEGGTFSGGPGSFTLAFTSEDDPGSAVDRTYHVAGPGAGGLLLPDSVTADVPSTLRDPANEADVIVLGDPNVMDTTPGSAFSNYWSHRASVDGFVVKVVAAGDVYDEFGYGIPHPQAFRNFLAYAHDFWKGPSQDPNRPPPAYVTLVGDTTADPKNNLNRGDWANVLPTFVMYQLSSVLGYYSSDNYIASFRGADQLADVHLGRIPVRTAAESANVFAKLYSYATAPPGGSWRGRGTFITDEGKSPGESSEFERITDDIVNLFWNPKPPHSAVKLYYDDPNYSSGGNATKMRNDMITALNNGTVLASYTGHGSFSIFFVDGLFVSADVNSLSANGLYSFQINENCLSGGFHSIGATDALSEAFLKAPGKGSIAFFAPAGLSFAFIGESINHQVYGDLFGPRRERRFGTLITKVRVTLGILGSIIDQQSYTLVGDPTLMLALPSPPPPSGLTAAGSNVRVDLAWNATPDPNDRTMVYRAENPAGPYTLLTPVAVAGTAYVDPNVINARTYYYQVASVDGEGYEGRRGNFNSDCVPSDPPSSGPDCVWARPVNTTPPQTPDNAVAFSDGSGVRLGVAWDPNPETDLAAYFVRYGTTQGGPYPIEVSAGSTATGVTLYNVDGQTTYYLRVSARNTSGYESAPTAELVGRPLEFTGQNPPRLIDTLMIVRTPGDADSVTLSWTPPSQDIYGGPTTIASYAVYRGTTPDFVPSPANRIAFISNASTTSYVDVGAHAASTSYYYVVASTDARGYTSGASWELPKGVSDIEAEMLPGGTTVRFTWNPITTDVAGNATTVSKYVLYASGSPVTRAQTESMTPIADDIQATSVDVAVNPAHLYYTLIVVDLRGNKSPF